MSDSENNASAENTENEHLSNTFDGKKNGLKNPILRLKMFILIVINLLNYMDRYTIAGVLTTLQEFYGITDAHGGLLQTTFMIFFMISSPICGFLGDRYTRKWIMVVGIAIWVLAVFASTFVPANRFWTFLFFRGVIGIGEASFVVISPSIIADMYAGADRSRMLMYFYFAIPFGSGLGFVVGSSVAALTGDWRWGIRITASLGILCLFLIIAFIDEPKRGAAECGRGEAENGMARTTYLDDLKSLLMNATYVFSTIGYTSLVFMVGTLTWWAPTAIEHNFAHKEGLNNTNQLRAEVKAHINFVFGFITCVGGLVGVASGSILSQCLHEGYGPFRCVKTVRSDAIICGIGALIGIPTLFFAIREIPRNMTVTWILMFICITASCFNWATNVNMLLNIVIPIRRNTATSWQTLISHLFGDASGPYILGMISDEIRGNDNSPYGNFESLVTSFYIPNFLLVTSSISFFLAAHTFVKDSQIARQQMGLSIKRNSQSVENRRNGGENYLAVKASSSNTMSTA